MPAHFDLYHRLEPRRPLEDLDRGFLAEVGDPLWFLGRQWQLGEHQGEDASSPVKVHFYEHSDPIDPHDGNPAMTPGLVPPEAIVESESDDWWTPGRRIRFGVAASDTLPPVADAAADPTLCKLLLIDLPVPYDRFDAQGYDGQKLYEQREALGLDPALFAGVPATNPGDLWNATELVYQTDFTCNGRTLTLDRHSGGHIDWYSVDAVEALPIPVSDENEYREYHPDHFRYPGAPLPRWWQIEDARVDIGGFPADRSHFATMLLIDLIASHSDDWFLFPLAAQAGAAVTPYTPHPENSQMIYGVTILDSFGDPWTVTPPDAPLEGEEPEDWSLYKVSGLPSATMLVWPTVTNPLAGPVLEDVVLGVDEDANLLFAVEQRVNGRDVPTPTHPEPASQTAQTSVLSGRKQYRYSPSTPVFPNWHPYEIHTITVDGVDRRRFVQGRLADFDPDPNDIDEAPALPPLPRAKVLRDSKAVPAPAEETPTTSHAAHQIEPATVPSQGLRLERRYMLTRRTDGEAVLWLQRRRSPLLAPPASHLRFDVMVEESVDGE
jgi:hypothetical protein